MPTTLNASIYHQDAP